MINHNIKNIAASVKSRLYNLSRDQKRPFQELLQYYGTERFLYRLSESQYREKFILKGALLFKIWKIADSRATLDIDTLANTSNSLDNLVAIIKELCEYPPSIADGIQFLTASITGRVMQLNREYEGIRIRFEGRLGSARIPMQVDIGFGDVITPKAEDVQYPHLLDFPGPKLKAYPPETVIAEKIQTMVEKSESNSRIKDYYDVWLLFRWPALPMKNLSLALSRTFKKRGMQFDLKTICSTINQYAKFPQTQILWERFKKKELPKIQDRVSFQDLASDLINFLCKYVSSNT